MYIFRKRRDMSQSGAVYQPTTENYETTNSPQERWSERPISYLAATVTQAARRPCGIPCLPTRNVLPVVLLVSGILTLVIGFIMLLNGAIGYTEGEPQEENYYLIVTIIGAVFFGLSVILLGKYFIERKFSDFTQLCVIFRYIFKINQKTVLPQWQGSFGHCRRTTFNRQSFHGPSRRGSVRSCIGGSLPAASRRRTKQINATGK